MKLVSSAGWLGSALEIGWGAQTSGGSLELSRCSFAAKEASWGLLIRIILGVHRACPTGRRPWGRPRKYISSGLGTPRDTPGGAGKHCWWGGYLDYLCFACCHRSPASDEWKKMDGWMDGLLLCHFFMSLTNLSLNYTYWTFLPSQNAPVVLVQQLTV